MKKTTQRNASPDSTLNGLAEALGVTVSAIAKARRRGTARLEGLAEEILADLIKKPKRRAHVSR